MKKNWRKDFPIFKTYPEMVYLDSAATSQKPIQVIAAVEEWYTKYNANVQRGMYTLAQSAQDKYEDARGTIAKFIGAKDKEEIVFCGNDTEGMNLVAYGWGGRNLKRGDVVAVSEAEHHSNLVPWMELRKRVGIEIVFMPITKNYELEYTQLAKLQKHTIKLVAITGASNVTGTIDPIAEIKDFMDRKKIAAKLVVDGAQLVPHVPVDVKKLGCDFLVWSGHKMLGPTGVGVVWGKKEMWEETNPLMVGSHMISRVTKEEAEWAERPARFEAGTGRLEAVYGLGAAVEYLTKVGMKKIQKHEEELGEYFLEKMNKMSDIQILGKTTMVGRLGVWSFNVRGVHAHDVGEILNRRQICVRTGNHCAQPLMKALGVPATVRASTYLYNDKGDIDKLGEGLAEVKRILKK